jgi:diacylglycerol O-acyltransferase / wax synthase
MSHGDRLSGLDNTFLHLEDGVAHMHVGACAIFDGPSPAYEDLISGIEARLHLVPRYRQRLAFVPFGQGRPVWVDDPQFRLRFHVRHTALPKPGSDAQLRQLAAQIFSQELDRGRPLWELWLIEGLSRKRFALVSKTHHALIDGVSAMDLASVMLDAQEPAGDAPDGVWGPWLPRPMPSSAQLLADALFDRMTVPGEVAQAARAILRSPLDVAGRAGTALVGLGALGWAGLEAAPRSPFNVKIGPHRRFTWVDASLVEFRAAKDALGGTINDAVLTVVAGALGGYMRERGLDTDELVLKAIVPVSVRSPRAGGAAPTLGNRVAAMWAPLPVGIEKPQERMAVISAAMREVKNSGQAIGAQTLTELAGFASPTLMAQAARLQARQRLFNLVVTNVPGPQVPLHLMGRRMRSIYPLVPLAANTALGIAVLSYDGRMNFGLSSDYDALPELESLADELRRAITALARAARAPR